MHCNLKAARLRIGRSGLFLANVALRIHINCYFRASDQNSGVAIRYSNPDFVKENNNLAIRGHLHAVTLTFDT